MGVADPYFVHEYRPNATRNPIGIHPAIAPALLSHLAMLSPTTFRMTAIARPMTENTMKYGALAESDWAERPPTKSALAAAKYSSPGKYGRFVDQYIQPVRNPANGPKACFVQTYKPPSSGYRDDNSSTVNTSGTKRNAAAIAHSTSALGPAAAAVAIQRRLNVVTT